MLEEDDEPAFQRPRLVESSPDVDKDAFIADRLKANPVLLNRFLQIRESSTTRIARPAPDVTNLPMDASLATKPSKPADAKTKYAFASSHERRVVHEKLTAERHRGKDPAVYVTNEIRSEAVLCKSLPGMLTRAFDWGFGIEGLSITHFKFMDRKQRMQWINSGGANFENFSATADFEPAPRVTTILEVVEAARVFSTFAREFCVSSAVELIDAIIAFIEAKRVAPISSHPKFVKDAASRIIAFAKSDKIFTNDVCKNSNKKQLHHH
ncbi:hypothetical protein PF005_g6502 [Phytophthora fragariae]|uniref:Uncharacterized protein n=1 Tax=Phytophthora fragariae TaxID=53985 RepID=A0A6A4A0A8_9STRA|nr:hypothetical protein PF010_g7278 [Phytophthora fragariae]KAE9222930.1 hypothetical protein PF005_g6502 [Phytophthora fragariae]KAE9245152.1 hypothetical protein PF002_g7393 [Phytophthora fragariae]KAE9317060.1 hypothetical protein PF001_g7012 [Phytophthora fragariae]